MNQDTQLDKGTADLHMHTTVSDGTIDIERRVELASDRGIGSIAITDHDIIADTLDAPTEKFGGIEVITGVEVRAEILDTKIEILGYFVDPSDDGLQAMLGKAREFRRERNRTLVSNLAEATGLALSYDDLSDSVQGNLGRPHMADVLVQRSVVDTVSEAFDQYLGETGEAFVPMQRLPAAEVLARIHDAGGTTSLAHPGRIRTDTETVEQMVEQLDGLGLDGIEVRYPYGSVKNPDYASIGVEEAAEVANRFDLIPTGGSDCHGPDSGKFRMGEVRINRTVLERLRDCTD